jgi:membrane-associated protease RseP (regulator of RpoE activity)
MFLQLGVITGLIGILAFIAVYTLNRIGMFAVEEVTVLRSMPQPVLGVTLDEHMVVVDVEEGGAAQESGVQVGDVFVAIADTPVQSINEAAAIMQTLRGQHTVTDAQSMVIEVDPQKQAEADARAAESIDSNSTQITQLTTRITIQRAGQELQMALTPKTVVAAPNQPTPTPVPQNYLYL